MRYDNQHLSEALGGFRLMDNSHSPYKPIPWPVPTIGESMKRIVQQPMKNTFRTGELGITEAYIERSDF